MSAAKPGAVTRIALIRPRDLVQVTGAIRSAATRSVGESPAFRCVLADGSGEIDLLFLGQDGICGLSPGRRCTARGRASVYASRLVLWNPRYELESAASRRPPAPRRPAEGGGRVALIGDDPAMCRIIEVNLATRGFDVRASATPDLAGPSVLHDADLVIVDIGVAGTGGATAIGRVRGSCAAPILAISALDGEQVKRAALGAGAGGFLVKPFPIGRLLASVAACVRG